MSTSAFAGNPVLPARPLVAVTRLLEQIASRRTVLRAIEGIPKDVGAAPGP